jgi:hypothetical protein
MSIAAVPSTNAEGTDLRKKFDEQEIEKVICP